MLEIMIMIHRVKNTTILQKKIIKNKIKSANVLNSWINLDIMKNVWYKVHKRVWYKVHKRVILIVKNIINIQFLIISIQCKNRIQNKVLKLIKINLNLIIKVEIMKTNKFRTSIIIHSITLKVNCKQIAAIKKIRKEMNRCYIR